MTWVTNGRAGEGAHERGYYCDEQCRPLVVIDPEDREAVERLVNIYEGTMRGDFVAEMQHALREFANPKPKREWRDGDVVQHVNDRYTAQRLDGEWHTTASGGRVWGDGDDYVTLNVETGFLRVLREQAAE